VHSTCYLHILVSCILPFYPRYRPRTCAYLFSLPLTSTTRVCLSTLSTRSSFFDYVFMIFYQQFDFQSTTVRLLHHSNLVHHTLPTFTPMEHHCSSNASMSTMMPNKELLLLSSTIVIFVSSFGVSSSTASARSLVSSRTSAPRLTRTSCHAMT
jgi:hypothetical protein